MFEPFGYHGGAGHVFGRWRAALVMVQQQAARAAIRLAQDLWLAVVGQQPGEGGAKSFVSSLRDMGRSYRARRWGDGGGGLPFYGGGYFLFEINLMNALSDTQYMVLRLPM